MARILLKYPTRQRPDLFRRTSGEYLRRLSGKHSVQLCVTMDRDDRTMKGMAEYLNALPNTVYCYGESKSKIEAINANMGDVDEWDVLILCSDDMIPQIDGYDDVVVQEMQRWENWDGSLHFNDGRVGNKLNTLSIMGRPMYERFGYIYHPDYQSLWCDNEYHEVTYGMGRNAYVDKVIISHDWVDSTGHDALFRKNNRYFKSDQRTFERRKKLGFPAGAVTV